MRRFFWLFFFPGGVVSFGVWAAQCWLPVSPTSEAAWLLFPYLVLLLGCFYAFRFGRIRLLYLLSALVLLERVNMMATAGAAGRFLFLSAALLVPLNFSLVGWMRERGLFSKSGTIRHLFFALQIIGVAWFEQHHLAYALALLERDWIAGATVNLGFPQTVLGGLIVGALLLLLRADRQPGILEIAHCWSYAVISWALFYPEYSRVAFATAGLIAALAVVEVTHFMAFRDELTGLPARRALTEYLARLGGRYTLVMADVDHFKKVNDTHGHDVGDQVLRMVATRLSRVGGGGRVFRYGGEEFTLLFAGKTAEASLPHVEKVREKLATEPFVMRRAGRSKHKPKQPQRNPETALQFKVTASFGVAQREDSSVSAMSVIKQADDALYRAKRSGRNCVCS